MTAGTAAPAAAVSWLKDGRVLYTEWETNDTTGYGNDISNEYYTFFNGELVEYTEPKKGTGIGAGQPDPSMSCAIPALRRANAAPT